MKKLWLLVVLFLAGLVMLIDIDLHTTLRVSADTIMIVSFVVICFVALL